MRKIALVSVCFLLLVPEVLSAADFDFYGVKFGIEKSEAEKVFRIKDEYGVNEAVNPGHGMTMLYFRFDHNNRLFQIEAYYSNEKNEKGEALLVALQNRFEKPSKNSSTDIDISMDSYTDVSRYGTADYFIMKITSKPFRSEYLKYLISDYSEKVK